MLQKGFDEVAATAESPSAPSDLLGQLLVIIRAEVGQGGGIQPGPEVFHGVQFGRVALQRDFHFNLSRRSAWRR